MFAQTNGAVTVPGVTLRLLTFILCRAAAVPKPYSGDRPGAQSQALLRKTFLSHSALLSLVLAQAKLRGGLTLQARCKMTECISTGLLNSLTFLTQRKNNTL